MKELLLQYSQYNQWANNLIIDVLLKLEDGAVDKEINSSFPSVRRTVQHILGAESIWQQRLLLEEHPVWHGDDLTIAFPETCRRWQMESFLLTRFVDKQYEDRAFTHVLQFYDRQKTSHKMPVCQVLQHVFNHSTYHRGQLVTMMRQLGLTKIPSTDFIGFARQR